MGGDTIAAVITPPGQGGIAAVRIAGERSLNILKRHFKSSGGRQVAWRPFQMRTGWFCGSNGERLDEVMAVYMPAGRSYTGLSQAEIYCHGGSEVVKLLLEQLLTSGARAAEPGEFTRLAFLNGRMDLTRAEAVAETIAANTETSLNVAREHLSGAYAEHIETLRNALVEILAEIEAGIDYPEEDISSENQRSSADVLSQLISTVSALNKSYDSGRILREGFKLVIAGRPNAGKSSLFNLLLKQQRALVAPTPGTTRDYLSEWIELDGLPVNIIDTAGLRLHSGQVEKAGQQVARRLVSDCDLLLWIIDVSRKRWRSEARSDLGRLGAHRSLLVGNKIDLLTKSLEPGNSDSDELIQISCLTRRGFPKFVQRLAQRVHSSMPDLTSGMVVTSARHRQKLQTAARQMKRAARLLRRRESPELVVFELRLAADALDEITGKIYNEEILDQIFSKFCIGK